MTRKRVGWLVAMLGLLLGSTVVVLAQKSDHIMASTRTLTMGGERAWMGVRLSDVTSEKAHELKLPGEYGAIVEKVEPDSPAAKTGLEKGDVILEFNGERVWSVAELSRRIRETPPGRTVSLRVSRDGHARTVSVKLESHGNEFFSYMPGPSVVQIPEVRMPPFNFHFGGPIGLMGGPRLGIEGDDLTSQLANYFGVKGGKGVLVREVNSGSAAEKAGLKAGDCIVAVDGKEVASVEDLRDALRGEPGSESGEKREPTLTIVRDRHEQSVKIEIEARPRRVQPEAEDELEGLRGEIADLRNEAPEARLQAEQLRRELEAQSGQWRAQVEAERGEIEKLQKQMTLESRKQLQEQAAQLRRQTEELRKQLGVESQQWKKQYLDQQMQLQKQLQRELLDEARQAPVI
ncbi:MAG TPA: PDZ domain-containing protein [Terriglobia bacterium]|nr:PDZ domain-containing protein [Terriglobia bacterium]